MYITNISKLKSDIVNHNITEADSIKYLIAATILYGLSAVPYGNYGSLDVFNSLLFVPISVFGIMYAYSENGGDNGERFLLKFVTISWVVTIRSLLVIIPLVVLYAISSAVIDPNMSTETTIWDVLVFSVVEIVVLWRVAVNIRHTCQPQSVAVGASA